MGKPLTVRRTYWQANQVDQAVSTARSDLSNGRLPWISLKLPHSWADMADGKGDAWATGLAHKLAALPGPVWLAFHHEPENDGPIRDWTAMQAHLAKVVRPEAPNVAYTIILTGWNQLYGPPEFSLESLWPEHTKIDIAGFDIYNFYGKVTGDTTNTHMVDLQSEYFDQIGAWASTTGVHWAVAETGFSDAAAAADPGWLQRSYEQMEQSGGIAMVYFNSSLNSTASWPLSTSDKSSLFTEVLSDSPSFAEPLA